MKKSCLISVILSLTGLFFIGFMLIMAATSALNTEQGRQESVTAVQTSTLNSYINVRTEQQIALVNTAKNEYTERGGTKTKSGNTYTNSSSNIQWDTYFVKYCMDTANISVPKWNKSCTVFATKLHLNGNFSLEKNYLPKSGDIVFFGRKINTLLDGQTIRANHCGIVSKVEMITDKTAINAMQITVIEGDVEGGIINGSYDHSTSYVETYTYDLYESTNTRYGQIMGYGTVVNDIPESDELVYTINLKSTFDEAQGGGSQ